jgi:hypothetical protein
MMRSRTPVRVSELAGAAATWGQDEHGFWQKIKRSHAKPSFDSNGAAERLEKNRRARRIPAFRESDSFTDSDLFLVLLYRNLSPLIPHPNALTKEND